MNLGYRMLILLTNHKEYCQENQQNQFALDTHSYEKWEILLNQKWKMKIIDTHSQNGFSLYI